jgi:DNA invertase Pin-like site-specific DNA recombinase
MSDIGKRAAIYTRVSTKDQTTDNQLQALHSWGARAGYTVVKVYEDHGISGAKGRDKRPAFDALLKDAVRREFDLIAVWSSDRLGRSLSHLVEVLQTIGNTGVGLYIHTQALDTTTPSGRALFQMLGVFAEFERELITERVRAGMARIGKELKAKGQFTTKAGIVRKQIGRPPAGQEAIEKAKALLASGKGILNTARDCGLGTGTVHKLKREMARA